MASSLVPTVEREMADSCKVIRHAAEAVQAQERLLWDLECQLRPQNGRDKAYECLEALIQQKAELEGSTPKFWCPQLQEKHLNELKLLTLMHVPSSITADTRMKFKSIVDLVMKGSCEKVISITLLTCPWYQASQRERGEQAKHNILLVVFMCSLDQFLAPASSHIKEKANSIDLGWFCALELSHFGQALCRGRTRYLEAVYSRKGAEIYSSPDWCSLRELLSYQTLSGTSGFLDACLGQAVGGISTKDKNGRIKLKSGSTIFQICESLRLLQHAANVVTSKSDHMEVQENLLPPLAVDSLRQLQSFYHHPEPWECKRQLFDLLISWEEELKLALQSQRATVLTRNQGEVQKCVGKWLLNTRLQGREINLSPTIPDSHSKLAELMGKVGGFVGTLRPDQILLMARAGSAMYNLCTASSDVDYLVIYTIPTRDIMSATKKLPEIHESRGLDKSVEYGAYEAHAFCEMLLKCSVIILELLFVQDHEFTSPAWQRLASQRQKFVTEKAMSQYLGLIRNNLKFINNKRHISSPKRDRKLFYQSFHKIHCVHQMLKGEVPTVKVDGEVREFIMEVRTCDEEKWNRHDVLEELQKRYKDLRESLAKRIQRLRENPDYLLLSQWLLSVRGF